MADQMTSLGVEFSKPEMRRIFHTVGTGVKVMEWGMGKIYSPKGWTTYPDAFYEMIPFMKLPPRKPGMYTTGGRLNKPLRRSKEYIHPSARIRYLYDADHWGCRALIENGYFLKQKEGPIRQRPSQVWDASRPFKTLLGDILPCHDISRDYGMNLAIRRVETHRLHSQDVKPIGDPNGYWVWQTADNQYELLEEQLGLWERMFININEQLLQYQRNREPQDTNGNDDLGKGGLSVNSWFLIPLRYIKPPSQTPDRKNVENITEIAPDPGYHDIITWLDD